MSIYFKNPRKTLKKKTTVYIVQQIVHGCSEEPNVFLNEYEADNFYLKTINQIHNKRFTEMEEAETYNSENSNDEGIEINRWEVKMK